MTTIQKNTLDFNHCWMLFNQTSVSNYMYKKGVYAYFYPYGMKESDNRNPPLELMQTEDFRRYFFLQLAYELELSGRDLQLNKPQYPNFLEHRLSIGGAYLTSESYDFIEYCIMTMGQAFSAEAHTTRIVEFNTLENKQAFQQDFERYLKSAQEELNILGGIAPDDYYRFCCNPQIIELIDYPQSHTVKFAIKLPSEIFKTVWFGHPVINRPHQIGINCTNEYILALGSKNNRKRFIAEFIDKQKQFEWVINSNGLMFEL